MSNGKNFTAEFKVKVVLEVLRENETASQIGAREGINPKVISNWKREFLDNAYRAFSISKDEKAVRGLLREHQDREQELLAKIGQLTYECDWLKKKSERFIGK